MRNYHINYKPVLRRTSILVQIAMLSLIMLPGCSATKTLSTPLIATQNVDSLQQYGNVSARLFALMTFEGYGQTLISPSDFNVPPISITWMGLIFNGALVGTGPGSDITYQVHGSVSADGAWVESMDYSTQVIRTSAYSGDFFRVTLKNVPLIQTFDSDNKRIVSCDKTGSDAQRFVAKIEYATGPLGSAITPPILSNFTYVTTDWDSTVCLPVLQLVFALGPGTQNTGGPATIPGGMGMRN
jgi:hypothetical protein